MLCPDKVKYAVFQHLRASNSKENSPIWPEIKVVQDFTAVLTTCKFKDDSGRGRYPPDNIFSIISLWENFSSLKGK